MCDKCAELDSKIEHYERLASRIADQPTLDGIKELIEQMKAKRPRYTPSKQSKAVSVGGLFHLAARPRGAVKSARHQHPRSIHHRFGGRSRGSPVIWRRIR
ncbi:MAG: hypothetical protein JWP25_985 [Bradyrhizobium sp.]|nr:hypothetical protein [Bradyrhizobium sp.]